MSFFSIDKLFDASAFSFTYGGKLAGELLPSWDVTRAETAVTDGVEHHKLTWNDPKTKLEIVCEAKAFADYSAVEWVMFFKNNGASDTPILENILPLDLAASLPAGDPVLRRMRGSDCSSADYTQIDRIVFPDMDISFAPVGGRSSNGEMPFFNLQWNGEGLIGAIGWSGQWAVRAKRDAGSKVSLQIGQQTTHLILHPGERIRTPRMLLLNYEGDDCLQGHNAFRRLMLQHYVPRINGEVALPPIAEMTWFTYDYGNTATEENQMASISAMAPLGVECYWLDAGWFEGGWPSGAGSWNPNPEAFPSGLRPLGDAAHEAGLRFVVWFEPERVNRNSRIAMELPEFVLKIDHPDEYYSENGLFNLGDPVARKWLTEHLSKRISDWGIDIYRNDFNIDPLLYWQSIDTPDRQGMAENRYIEGLYAMWDELRSRHPGLLIDNCASGGRRIDLETNSRSLPLWQSDTQCCGKAMPSWDQSQNVSLNLYVPLHSAGVWSFDPYTWRSIANAGVNLCMDTRGEMNRELAKRMIDETEALRPFQLGDFYPHTGTGVDETCCCVYQFDRPDMNAGYVMALRRENSPYPQVELRLQALDENATYEVGLVDSNMATAMKGKELKNLRIEFCSAPASILLTYRKG